MERGSEMGKAKAERSKAGKENLNEAFETFSEASGKLVEQYSALEKRVEELNCEINEKNRVMERTRRLAAMGEMAAKIAHEIRNPLASIAIFSDLLERELEGEPQRKRLASHITKGVKVLDNILSNMLLFAGGHGLSKKSVDLKEVIEDSIIVSSGHGAGPVLVNTSYDGPTRIMGDEGLLRQLFTNLFINAFDAMKGGGTLTVKSLFKEGGVEGSPGSIYVEVRDTGKGIEKEHLDRIFDPFFSTKERGTGLGLAIVASVVTAHTAAIDVDSAPGKGTAFTITFPAPG